MKKSHQCPTCSRRLRTADGLAQHIHDVHGNGPRRTAGPKTIAKRNRNGRVYQKARRFGNVLPCPVHAVALEKRSGKFGAFYGCPHWPYCDIIGDWSDHDGLFRLSTQADRDARKLAHAAFDPIWRSGRMKRSEAYAWLAGQLGIKPERAQFDCHIKHFSQTTALRVVELCRVFEISWCGMVNEQQEAESHLKGIAAQYPGREA